MIDGGTSVSLLIEQSATIAQMAAKLRECQERFDKLAQYMDLCQPLLPKDCDLSHLAKPAAAMARELNEFLSRIRRV